MVDWKTATNSNIPFKIASGEEKWLEKNIPNNLFIKGIEKEFKHRWIRNPSQAQALDLWVNTAQMEKAAKLDWLSRLLQMP